MTLEFKYRRNRKLFPSAFGFIVLVRDATRRPKDVDARTLKLVGTDEEVIYKESTKLLDKEERSKMTKAVIPYGDGHACERVADISEGKEYKEWLD